MRKEAKRLAMKALLSSVKAMLRLWSGYVKALVGQEISRAPVP